MTNGKRTLEQRKLFHQWYEKIGEYIVQYSKISYTNCMVIMFSIFNKKL